MGNTARETNNPGWRSKQHSEEAETRLDLRYWSIRIYSKNTFQRRRDINADPAEDIAINKEGGAFNVFSKFILNYSAITPATLILNPVTNG